jgi:hypothetical protein
VTSNLVVLGELFAEDECFQDLEFYLLISMVNDTTLVDAYIIGVGFIR